MALLAGLALAAAAAPQAGWAVTGGNGSSVVLTRTLAPVTIEYRTVADDADTLKLTVDPCGQSPWYDKADIVPQGETAAERTAFVREAVMEEFHNARLNCTLPVDTETRMIDGFDAAFTQLEATTR